MIDWLLRSEGDGKCVIETSSNKKYLTIFLDKNYFKNLIRDMI